MVIVQVYWQKYLFLCEVSDDPQLELWIKTQWLTSFYEVFEVKVDIPFLFYQFC